MGGVQAAHPGHRCTSKVEIMLHVLPAQSVTYTSHHKARKWIGLARTVYMHRLWLYYIRWFPCQNYRIYTVQIQFFENECRQSMQSITCAPTWRFKSIQHKWRRRLSSPKMNWGPLFCSKTVMAVVITCVPTLAGACNCAHMCDCGNHLRSYFSRRLRLCQHVCLREFACQSCWFLHACVLVIVCLCVYVCVLVQVCMRVYMRACGVEHACYLRVCL